VSERPGCFQARKTGKLVIAPPKKIAAQMCQCVWLEAPIQVFGEIHQAAAIPASH
jgi:hypothetical protein